MTAALKVWTKKELFDKTMSLAKLQKIATGYEIPFETDANKASIAHLILNKQRDLSLTSPAEPEDAPAPGVDDQTASEVAAQNGQAASAAGEFLAAGVTSEAAQAGKTDDLGERELPPAPTTPPAAQEEAQSPQKPDSESEEKDEERPPVPDAIVEELRERLGMKSLEARLRELEHFKDTHVAKEKHDGTLHGHIDNLPRVENLPPPGKIDDLPKL